MQDWRWEGVIEGGLNSASSGSRGLRGGDPGESGSWMSSFQRRRYERHTNGRYWGRVHVSLAYSLKWQWKALEGYTVILPLASVVVFPTPLGSNMLMRRAFCDSGT